MTTKLIKATIIATPIYTPMALAMKRAALAK